MSKVYKEVTRNIRLGAVIALMWLSMVMTGLAQTESYWKSWPQDPDWVALSNHIGRCYQALLWRCQAVGVSTNGIEPAYEYPWYDYEAFAKKIDQLAPYFVCPLYTNSSGNFSDYFATEIATGVYTNQFPFWNAKTLRSAAGFDDWSTNVLLHSWAVSGRELQEQVAAAIPLLFMTCPKSTNVSWTGAEGYSAVSNFVTNATIQTSNGIAFPPMSSDAWQNFNNEPFGSWPAFQILSRGAAVPTNSPPEISGSWEARFWHEINLSYTWTDATERVEENISKIVSTNCTEVRDRLEKCTATNVQSRFCVTGLVASVKSKCQFYYREEALTNRHAGGYLRVNILRDAPGYWYNNAGFIGNDWWHTNYNPPEVPPYGNDPLGSDYLRAPLDFARPCIIYFGGGDSASAASSTQVSGMPLRMNNYAPSSAEAYYSMRTHEYDFNACFAHTCVETFDEQWSNSSEDGTPVSNQWHYSGRETVPDKQGCESYTIISVSTNFTARRYRTTLLGDRSRPPLKLVWKHAAKSPMALVIWESEELSLPEDNSIQPCDTDLDDVSETSVMPRNIKPDHGTMTWLAEQEEPELRLWLGETPAWYGGIPVSAWLSQGAGCGLPYQYLVKRFNGVWSSRDEDGSRQSLNLATKLLESNAIQEGERKEKKASVLRPRGQLVVFDFPWDEVNQKFSDTGYPQGRYAARSYVLRDRTPAYDKDCNYDLCFDSGIVHQFGVSMIPACASYVTDFYGGDWDVVAELNQWVFSSRGVLTCVKRYDGKIVWIALRESIDMPSIFVLPGFWLRVERGTDGATGNPYLKWMVDDGKEQVRAVLSNETQIDRVERTTGVESSVLNTTIDAYGFITGFSVSGIEPAGSLNVAFDRDEHKLSYAWGTVMRAQVGASDAARTVTMQAMHADHGSVEEIYEIGADDRLRKRTVNAVGDTVWLQYQYSGEAGRYGNGFPKKAKIATIQQSNGKQASFGYWSDTGWLGSRTEPIGNGVDRVVEYSYEKPAGSDGDSADTLWAVERPRQVTAKYGGAVIGSTLYSFNGGQKIEERRCAVWPADWNSAGNLARVVTLHTNTFDGYIYYELWPCDLSGLPLRIEEPGCTSVWSHFEWGSLSSHANHSDGRAEYVVIDRCGNQTIYQGMEAGITVTAQRVSADLWGRPVGVEDQMSGEVTSNLAWTVYGPAQIRGPDGSVTVRQFYPGGLLQLETNGVTGEQTSLIYDSLGNVVSSTRTGGTQSIAVQSQFDAGGRIRSQTDALGATTWNWQNAAWGSSVVISRPDGSVETEERYFDGSLKRRTGSGVTGWMRKEYGVEGGAYRETTICLDALGQDTPEWSAVTHDILGRPVCAFKPLADGSGVASNVMRYDAQGRLCETEDEEGARALTSYGPDRRVRDRGRHVDGAVNALTPASRDRYKTVQTTVMADRTKTVESGYLTPHVGTATELSVSESMHHGRSGSVTVAGRSDTWSRSVPAEGGVWQEEDCTSDGRRVVRKYEHARLKQTEWYGSDGALRELEFRNYDGLGALQQISHSRRGITTYQYDTCRRLSSIIPSDPQKGFQTFAYHHGTTRWQSRSDGDGRVYFRDYYLNGLLKRDYGSTLDVSYEYDTQGRCVKMKTLRNGQIIVTEWKYNRYTGELAEKLEHGKAVPVATYDWRKNGELDRVTFADGSAAVSLYDAASGDKVGVSYTDGTGGLSMQFDRAGRQTAMTVEGGVTESCDYTVDGRISREQIRGNGIVSNSTLTYAYGPHGAQTSLVWQVDGVASGRNDIAWDQHMRVSGVTSLWGSVDYGYLTNGSLVTGLTVRLADGLTFRKSVTWDLKNERVDQIGWTADGIEVSRYDYQYPTNSDKVARVVREDGSAWEYAYGVRGELESGGFISKEGYPVPGRQFAYQYDEIGNIIESGRVKNGVIEHNFIADDGNRHVTRKWGDKVYVIGTAESNAVVSVNGMRAEQAGKYFSVRVPVDNAAGSVKAGITVNAVLNQGTSEVYSSSSGVLEVPQAVESVQHRLRGGIQQDSRFQYEWDGRDRLVRLTSRDGLRKTEFDYDGHGRRVRKVVSNRANAGGEWVEAVRHEFYYEGWTLMCEKIQRAGADPAVRQYTWDRSMSLPVLLAFSQSSASVTSAYLVVTDRLGSVEKVFNAATGSIVAEYGYSPFGVLISEVAAAANAASAFRFQGKYYDSESGFYYFGYRYYDPASGKWLSPDPIQERGGPNFSAFCNNDPVNGVDELGLDVYVVYRQFNDIAEGGELAARFKGGTRGGIGHVYLAFDEVGVDRDKWEDLVTEYHADPTSIVPPRNANRFAETFSFHPWGVREMNGKSDLSSDIGKKAGLPEAVVTEGSYIGYNDAVDQEAFLDTKKLHTLKGVDHISFELNKESLDARLVKIVATEEEQFALYRQVQESRRINNISAASGDIGSYSVTWRNCGYWAVTMLGKQKHQIPSVVRGFNKGVGVDPDKYLNLHRGGKVLTEVVLRPASKGANAIGAQWTPFETEDEESPVYGLALSWRFGRVR